MIAPLKQTQQDNEPQDKAYRDLKKKVLQDEADVEDQEAALKVRRKLQKDRNRRLKWVINTLLKGASSVKSSHLAHTRAQQLQEKKRKK